MKKNNRHSPFGFLYLFLGALLIAMVIKLFWDPIVPSTSQAFTPTRAPTHMPTITQRPFFEATITHSVVNIYRPVTWMELVKFIEDDHTNWNEFDINNYVCLDFAIDLVENAGKKNIKAWIVAVDFDNQELGHAFAAFETTDHGIVYIEPQGDNTYIDITVGQPLCDAWGVYECIGIVSSIEFIQCDSDHSHYCRPFTP